MRALNEEDDYSIPMTPMIDIVFQLLIFFLLATTIQEEEIDVQVMLPPGSQGSQQGSAAGTKLVVGVRKDGTPTLGGSNIEWDELRRRLMDAGRAQPKPSVYIRGDREALNAHMFKIYQICLEAGLTNLHLSGVRQDSNAP